MQEDFENRATGPRVRRSIAAAGRGLPSKVYHSSRDVACLLVSFTERFEVFLGMFAIVVRQTLRGEGIGRFVAGIFELGLHFLAHFALANASACPSTTAGPGRTCCCTLESYSPGLILLSWGRPSICPCPPGVRPAYCPGRLYSPGPDTVCIPLNSWPRRFAQASSTIATPRWLETRPLQVLLQ